jgi:GxxExxY protein
MEENNISFKIRGCIFKVYIAEVHHKQVLTYLKLTGLKLGLLVNFNSEDISQSIFRKVNGL